MTTEPHQITVEGIPVEVVRKRIKNLHLAVYPPDGRVRLAVPLHLDDEAARLAVVTRLPWVRRKQDAVRAQAREAEREMVSGETHYVAGDRYLLDVVLHEGPAQVEIAGRKRLRLRVSPEMLREGRQRVLDRWYRERLRPRVAELVATWSERTGVEPPEWRIKRMKTKWGSCSPAARRIWLNLELAKKSDRCLEYIVVHELVHLLEPSHNDRFRDLMTRHLPTWRTRRDELNRSPLAFEDWTY